MYGRGLALLEASLVDLGCQEWLSLFFYLRQDGLLHDLSDVGSHHDGSDLVEPHGSSPRCLLQRHNSPQLQVLRDVSKVEGVQDLVRDLLAKDFICLDDVIIKTVWSQALIEVAGLDGVSDVRESQKLLQLTVICSC